MLQTELFIPPMTQVIDQSSQTSSKSEKILKDFVDKLFSYSVAVSVAIENIDERLKQCFLMERKTSVLHVTAIFQQRKPVM